MKVMLNPVCGTTVSYCGNSCVAKQTEIKIPKQAQGYSNEEIYNAIMSVKKTISKILPRASKKSLNTIA